jgi:hypothetical protein
MCLGKGGACEQGNGSATVQWAWVCEAPFVDLRDERQGCRSCEQFVLLLINGSFLQFELLSYSADWFCLLSAQLYGLPVMCCDSPEKFHIQMPRPE